MTDTAAIAELEIRRFGQNGGTELDNAVTLLDLMAQFPSAEAQGIFTDLFWPEDPNAPTTIDPAEKTFTPDPRTPFSGAQMALLASYETEIRNAASAFAGEQRMLASLGPQVGWPYEFPATASNAMVVSAPLTANGHPILLGGPRPA